MDFVEASASLEEDDDENKPQTITMQLYNFPTKPPPSKQASARSQLVPIGDLSSVIARRCENKVSCVSEQANAGPSSSTSSSRSQALKGGEIENRGPRRRR